MVNPPFLYGGKDRSSNPNGTVEGKLGTGPGKGRIVFLEA